MTGFIDVLLRGLLLALASVAAGGVAWVLLVLRVDAHAKPTAAVARSLRLVGAASLGAAAVQSAVALTVLREVIVNAGMSALPVYLGTGFARVSLVRVVLAVALGVLALRLAREPAGRVAWSVLAVLAAAFVVSSAALSHAAARIDHRLLLGALDAVHQLAVATWVGGLAHLVLHAARARTEPEPRDRGVVARFSNLALVSIAVIVATGAGLTALYVGEPAALVGTAYGVMILSKVVLLLAALALGAVNLRLVRRGAEASHGTLSRLIEVELGLGLTIIFAAASLTSLPPATDVAAADRATVSEVAARFMPVMPRLSSPPIDELLRAANPLMAPPGERTAVERAWSEYNHHWAGLFVLLMGSLALLERAGVRTARHWPLAFLGMAAFLFVRNDPRAWPLGPTGFWESMTLPDVLQHRAYTALIVAFGVFEWMVRTGRLRPRPWSYVFPLLCAAGGGLLLTHSHAMLNLKDEFLTEISHAPLGLLGAFAGWARWIEVRLPEAGSAPGWTWRGSLAAVGVLLLLYHER
jgi:putative copper resistance protein D